MEILRIAEETAPEIAALAAAFRVALRSYKGIASEMDARAAEEEIRDFIQAGYPVFAARDGENYLGYVVCRIEDTILWVEQLYVAEAFRRRGIASMLFGKAEEIARSLGEETVFNYVHPNNDGMIAFLRAKGYTVLNLIEIRKPYRDERLTATIQVNHHTFDY